LHYLFVGIGIALLLFVLAVLLWRDWPRLTRSLRRAQGEVCSHRKSDGVDGVSYAAVYRFTAEDGPHEVIDPVYGHSPRPPLGTRVELTYPEGRPDLARPPRPLLWGMLYLIVLGTLAQLIAIWFGWLD
jgi:hypothetical protein